MQLVILLVMSGLFLCGIILFLLNKGYLGQALDPENRPKGRDIKP